MVRWQPTCRSVEPFGNKLKEVKNRYNIIHRAGSSQLAQEQESGLNRIEKDGRGGRRTEDES